VQHLTRLLGRARALEVMLSGEDYDADLAERYGWINRALPARELGDFVRALAHRIAGFPAAGPAALKERINAITLAPADDFRRDSDLFGAAARTPETQGRFGAAMKRGFQTATRRWRWPGWSATWPISRVPAASPTPGMPPRAG
jgi:enoyl-CoA hydratase/carnithine racemase